MATFETGHGLAVEDFYDERLAEKAGHAFARELAFDRVATVGTWHVRRQLRAVLREVIGDAGARRVRIASVAFEEFDSGRMHAAGHFAVTLTGPSDALATFAASWEGVGGPAE